MAVSMRLHPGVGRPTNTTQQKTEADLWTAAVCTDARTCDPQLPEWGTKLPKVVVRGAPGEAMSVVAAARQALVRVKQSWRQHDAPRAMLASRPEPCAYGAEAGNSPSLQASS